MISEKQQIHHCNLILCRHRHPAQLPVPKGLASWTSQDTIRLSLLSPKLLADQLMVFAALCWPSASASLLERPSWWLETSASFKTLFSSSQIVFRALYYSIKISIRILSHAHHLGPRKTHQWELPSPAVLKLGVVLWTWGLVLHTGSIFIHLQTFEVVIHLHTTTISQLICN